MNGSARFLLAAAGILGAAGIAAAAGASHAGDERILGSLALVALTQAPALLAIALLPSAPRLVRAGGTVIALGALLFSADLAIRHFAGAGLVPFTAPLGGAATIAGWLLLAMAAVTTRSG